MATLVLAAAGAGIGASIGGSVLGLSSVVIGQAAGAIAGRMIDNRLMGEGADPVETGRVDRLRITGVSEGAAVPHLFGRFRTGGHVIWASKVREHRTLTDGEATGSGKGLMAPQAATVTEFSYSVSLAIALCEGEITHVGRVWADGTEIKPAALTMRVYPGDEDQLPDPALDAALGGAPAFRGTAYVVIENLDLTGFGNRIPVLNFEVFRPEQPGETPGVARGTRAVALIPGSGEYVLATEPVHFNEGRGRRRPVNRNTPLGKTDFKVSLDQLEGECPNVESVSLVVSWFADDLRAANCRVRPRVDQKDLDGETMPWRVSGLARAGAGLVPYVAGEAQYGGTPSDQSVTQAIAELQARGKAVTFYPFIQMEQLAENALPDPWSDAPDQPQFPWRGRITLSVAPGQDGSPDGTATADAEVAAFFGTAQSSDFTAENGTVSYTGPAGWTYRRFILHYATLCADIGGVEAFLIGSELRGLTQIRGAGGGFPVVDALVALAADVRAILGPDVRISYAADWSEYFGYHPQDGSGDVFFHLDPLWSDANIDFIGIDNYMPLSDWRDGEDHADAHWRSIYNLDYLKAGVQGGEGFDWYYHAPEARAVQLRSPITDGAYDEPWVFRYKDLRGWWEHLHHDRPGGIRAASPTGWQPGSKPIVFTEIGCAAVDKATNEPNRFLDPKSAESGLPRHSNGRRDDVIQAQYLRALREVWEDPAHNPTHPVTGVTMIDMSRAHVWAWDARPFPWFPNRRTLWGDWENHARGHWLNGRASMRSLASVIEEICARSGVGAVDTRAAYGALRGYAVTEVTDARAALQPLMLAYGIEAAEREGVLAFFCRDGRTTGPLEVSELVALGGTEGDLDLVRTPDAERVGRVRLTAIEAGGAYEPRSREAVFPDEETHGIAGSDLPLVLTGDEAQAITERWLAEARVSRDRARFAVPPSQAGLQAGDVVEIDPGTGPARFRIDHVEAGGARIVQAVRVEPGTGDPALGLDQEVALDDFTPTIPVEAIWLDLPDLAGSAEPHRPHLAIAADPWPGPVLVHAAARDAGYVLNARITAAARHGVTESPMPYARPGLIDRGPALRVRMLNGALSSAGEEGILNGANLAMIGTGGPDGWEVFQFAEAVLVEPDVYDLSLRLRGQAGSDPFIARDWEPGATLVIWDGSVTPLSLPLGARGLERHYRIGPASEPLSDPSHAHVVITTQGVGLRPYRPVHIRASRIGADLAVSWVRRTRVDGDSWQGAEVPLGEEQELYQVSVVHAGEVVRRTEVTTNTWLYEAAQQLSDGVSVPFRIDVTQVSASFGPGPDARLDVLV